MNAKQGLAAICGFSEHDQVDPGEVMLAAFGACHVVLVLEVKKRSKIQRFHSCVSDYLCMI